MERVALGVKPATLLQQVQSSSGELIVKRLGFGRTATRARLVEAQLDEDPDREAILEMDFQSNVAVCVLDRTGADWFSLGCTTMIMPFQESYELRKATSTQWQNLVVHNRGIGCGGGYCGSTFGILHVAGGRMYEVLRVEDGVDTICFEKRVQILIPDPGFLVVRSEAKGTAGAAPICAPVERERHCAAIRWDEGALAFVSDRAATVKRCRK